MESKNLYRTIAKRKGSLHVHNLSQGSKYKPSERISMHVAG
jgi:hypothetical protein